MTGFGTNTLTAEFTQRLQTSLGDAYKIERELGGGGMSFVFVADEAALGRKVAVKVLRPDLSAGISTERFKREILLAARLQHPHILPVLSTGEIDGLPYYTMPFVVGESLEARLARDGPIETREAARLLAGVARALSYAHRMSVVHRDIKPGNVLIADGTAVVTDFGIAKALASARQQSSGVQQGGAGPDATSGATDVQALTAVGVTVGTPAYMAPEQISADPATDHRADIYSFGVLAFEVLTGKRPFNASSYQALAVAHLTAPPPLEELSEDIPPDFILLIARCLAKDPADRPAGAEQLVTILESLASGDRTNDPLAALAVSAERRARAPSAAGVRSAGPIIARDAEHAELAASFQHVSTQAGVLHALVGEAGLGKTTLVEHFIDTLAAERPDVRVGRGRCSERLAGTEAYLPFLEALGSLVARKGGSSVAREMRVIAPAWYLQVQPALSSSVSGPRTPPDARAGSSEQMKRQLAMLLLELTRTQPLVLFLDDVHWADASTVDLISYLADRFDTSHLLLIVTYRPSELQLARHPLVEVTNRVQSRGFLRETRLHAFDLRALGGYLSAAYPDNRFPSTFLELLHARTEGIPLFVVDLVRQLANRGIITNKGGPWRLEQSLESIESELPASIRSIIQRTIGRLDESDRRLLVAASVQGAEFDSAVVARAIAINSAEVEERLERLERVHAIVRLVDERVLANRTPSLRYAFAHILYQNTLHATLRATRRMSLSGAVAAAIREYYGDDAAQASRLGILFSAAHQYSEAAASFLIAARAASRLFASKEAVLLARRGLEALEALPTGDERNRLELQLQLALGVPLTELFGYTAPEVETAYTRARELGAASNDPVSQVPVLHGLYRFYTVRGRLHGARDVVQELIQVAERTGDPGQMLVARAAMGPPLIHLGEFESAVQYLEAGLEGYDPQKQTDRTVYSAFMPACWLAVARWLLGQPHEALEADRLAHQMADQQQYPFALAYAECLSAWLHQYRGDAETVKRHADAAMELARTHDFRQWLALAAMFRGWALVALGNAQEGLAHLGGAIQGFTRTGAELNLPHFLTMLADAHLRTGNAATGLETIDRALAIAEKNDDRCWEPEIHRVKGELLLHASRSRARGDEKAGGDGTSADADAAFRKALGVAERQKSRSLQLRAALSLSRLLVEEGRRDDARLAVAAAVGHFAPDVRMPELTEAREFLAGS